MKKQEEKESTFDSSES